MDDATAWFVMMVDALVLIPLYASVVAAAWQFVSDRRLSDDWKWAIPLFIVFLVLTLAAIALLVISAVKLVTIGL